MTKFNQFSMIFRRMIEANREGTLEEKVHANYRMAKFLGGTAAQGLMYSILASYAFGGPEGGQQRIRERLGKAKDEPLMFLIDSLGSAMGGPLYILYQEMKHQGLLGVGDAATKMMFPISVTADLGMALSSQGRYRDRDLVDRLGLFLEQKTPGWRVLRAQVAAYALGADAKESQKLMQDIKAANAWRRDTYGWKRVEEHLENDLRENFRVAMKKAMSEFQENGKTDDYRKNLRAAYMSLHRDVKPKDRDRAISGAIRSRKILVNNNNGKLTRDEQNSLIARIGDEAYRRLQIYDNMLEEAAP